jgi:uncharacterized protein YlaI
MNSLIQAVCKGSLRLKCVTSLPLSMIIFSLFLLLMLFFNISHPIFHSHPLLPRFHTLSLLLTTFYILLPHPLFKVETERRLMIQEKLLYVPTDHGKEISDDELETTYLRNAQVRTYTTHQCATRRMVKSRRDVKRKFELFSVVNT